jgi:hypothetical protein
MTEKNTNFRQSAGRTVIYGAILLLLLMVYIFQETVTRSRNTITVADIGDSATQIQIDTPEGTLVLQGGPESWTVGDKAYPGDIQLVDELISTVGNLGDVDTISRRGGYSGFGLDEEQQRTLEITYGQDETLTLSFGNSAAAGNALYARINGSREVVLLPASLDRWITVDPSSFRDHLMLEVPESSVESLEISAPGSDPVNLRQKISDKGDPGWEVLSGDEPVSSVTEEAVDRLFQELSMLEADAFIESEPETEIVASLKVKLSNKSEKTISIRHSEDEGSYILEVSGNPYLFTLSEWNVRRLLLGRDEYFR